MEYEVGLKLYERVKKGAKLVVPVEEEAAVARAGGLPLRRRILERRAARLPVLASRAAASRRAATVSAPRSPPRCSPRRPPAPLPGTRAEPHRHQAEGARGAGHQAASATSSRWTAPSARPRSSSPRAATRPYLPDLQFRLAELYVEKSRYVYYLQAETAARGREGRASSRPETRAAEAEGGAALLPPAARVPGLQGRDKVTFYLAHEQRELGQFDEMLKTLGDLIRKYPQSPLRLEAEQIIGDYFFDKADLVEAEKHYQAILEQPPSPVHDLARYKMGWIRINQGKHAEAVTFFEAAAASAPLPGVDAQKALNVKREALLDLVYSYTEARPAKGALHYFEKLSESRATYALALDKLGNRYFIKQQYEFAIPALRKLMEIQPDPELDLERAQKLYDSLKAAKGKVPPRAGGRALPGARGGAEQDGPDQGRARAQEAARRAGGDGARPVHAAPRGGAEEGRAQRSTWRRRRPTASTCRCSARRQSVRAHHAATAPTRSSPPKPTRTRPASSRSWPATRSSAKDEKGHGVRPLRRAALRTSPRSSRARRTGCNAFQVADARQALKLLGASFVAKYPRSEHAVEVKFNIARAYYDDGEYDKAAELFTAFALAHPDTQGRGRGRPPGAGLAAPAQRLQGPGGHRHQAPRRQAAGRSSSPRCAASSRRAAPRPWTSWRSRAPRRRATSSTACSRWPRPEQGPGDGREGPLRRLHRRAREARPAPGAGVWPRAWWPTTRRASTSPTCC